MPLSEKLYLSLPEAVAYTGLGAGYLQEHCTGILAGPHGRLVFKRVDLEKL